MTTAKLLSPGTRVRRAICRECVEAWIVERRAAEDEKRKIRTPTCEGPHQEGVVMPYDMEYSSGIFPVSFGGIWMNVMAVDVIDISDEKRASVTKLKPGAA